MKSDQIVSGRVAGASTSWGPERKVIWTRYEIAVDETWKGSAGKTLIVSEPGGSLDGLTLMVPGAVRYRTGERVTLFVHRFPSGETRTVGWAQGKFVTDARGRVHPAAPAGRDMGTGTWIPSLDGLSREALRQRVILAGRKAAE